MTEEQKIKCEEIYNSYNLNSRYIVEKDEFIKITMLLAKVFNRDITEEEAEKIISINEAIYVGANVIDININIETFWNIVNYFEEQQKRCEEIINSSEEKYKKSLEELLDNFHEGYVPWALLFHYGNMDTIFYYYNPISMLFGGMVPLSFILSQMEGVENEFFEFLGDSKDKTAEIIIDATVSLSEIFNKNMTKEEVEKLLFIKNDTKEEKFGTAYLGKFCVFTEEFRKIIEEYEEDKYGIERVISAIANYFDNGNKETKKENKNNKENKINNVVENTAKEKIMSNNDELTLNLLILGKTGVGKSSLLNALVGKEVEETRSASKPVTKRGIFPHEAEIDGKKVIIHDSWGLEVGKDEEWEKIIKDALNEKGIDKDIKDWFHSVTYCIQAGGDRIEDFDLKMIKQFIDEKYNVIVALTKADQINEEKEEKFINTIKKDAGIDTVVSISANPERKRGETEAPKPFGLPEYKAAILISWRKIFINRIPVHIVKKLKEDIENAKKNAPRKGSDLEKLAKEIQEYFINVVKEKVQSHVKDNFEKYYKITEDIFAASKNIDISNVNLYGSIDDTDYILSVFDFDSDIETTIASIIAMVILSPLTILSGLIDLIQLIVFNVRKSEKIDEFINYVSSQIIEKISEEKFEDEVRKNIINALNEIDKKIIKLN